MAVIVFAAVGFLACAFLLFVLVQWIRDGKRKTTTHPDVGNKVGEPREKRRQVLIFPGTAERRDRPKAGTHQVSGSAERPCGYERGRDDHERIAYGKIARFSRTGNRT
jgi:hypothetical protein